MLEMPVMAMTNSSTRSRVRRVLRQALGALNPETVLMAL